MSPLRSIGFAKMIGAILVVMLAISLFQTAWPAQLHHRVNRQFDRTDRISWERKEIFFCHLWRAELTK